MQIHRLRCQVQMRADQGHNVIYSQDAYPVNAADLPPHPAVQIMGSCSLPIRPRIRCRTLSASTRTAPRSALANRELAQPRGVRIVPLRDPENSAPAIQAIYSGGFAHL